MAEEAAAAENWRDLVRPASEGARFAVRLTPKGGADALEGLDRDDAGRLFLKARVRAAPEKGAANAALLTLLAKRLGIPGRDLEIAAGAQARLKTVAARRAPEALAEALAAAHEKGA
ncbi:DUF167 family protein [Neomegalonema perideroedes]|uniref:DUF167 family protein n=1 Tax=Neomegalonema perideroedes TaxID=217219 RepID=UPI00036DB85C|nr:DUF167 family protein [Neomegalonema perideroedes]